MNESSVKIAIPVRNGDFETAWANASAIRQELESFFGLLRKAIYYNENMPRDLYVTRRLEAKLEAKDNVALVVEAVWVGNDWIREAAEEYINTYIQKTNIGE